VPINKQIKNVCITTSYLKKKIEILFLSILKFIKTINNQQIKMQLRSGRSTLATRTQTQVRTLRRDSRNYEEFNERRKYQEEQKQIEASIYEEDEQDEEDIQTPGEKKWKHISKRIKHLLYLNECQRQQKCTFTERVKTINELYEFVLYNMDDLIDLFNGEMKHRRNFPEVVYTKGNELRADIARANKKTRGQQQLAWECNDLINHATQLIYRHILSTFEKR